MKHLLLMSILFLGLTSNALGQGRSETYFLYLSQNIQIDDFKDSKLATTCNSEAQAIYAFSKKIYNHIKSLSTSTCPIIVTMTYGDMPLRQQTFDKGPKRETSKIVGTLDLYAQNSCTQKSFEASWSITKSPTCKATTYINGSHELNQNAEACILSTYVNDQRDWLEQALAEKLQ